MLNVASLIGIDASKTELVVAVAPQNVVRKDGKPPADLVASGVGRTRRIMSVFFASGCCTLDLRTQYEMGWRDSGTHSADETGTPSRCARISHRQPSGHSRSFLQDCTLVRFDVGITGFAPGHSQVADPFCHCMHI